MNAESQQLAEVYRNITEQFINHPLIRIEAVKGDPPEQYEITYKIPCAVKAPDGRVVQQSGNTIIITIPFGFPHFPPTCKPKGQIFHPDFDSAAICLGDFWQNHRDLGDLIRHIGAMLSGEIYSTENTFNEEAARWYREHKDQLPFTVTGLLQKGWSPHDAPAPAKKDDDMLTLLELDVLEEEERGAQEQRGNDHSDGPVAALSGDLASGNRDKSAKLWDLSQKKLYMRLKRELDTLELGESVEGQEALVQKTHAALAEARELYRQADEEECSGSMEKAAELYARVAAQVADFPDIDLAIQRTNNSKKVLNDLYQPQSTAAKTLVVAQTDTALPPQRTKPGKGGFLPARQKDKSLSAAAPPKAPPIYNRKLHIGIVPLTAVACLAIVVAVVGYLWLSGNERLGAAEGMLFQCRQAMIDLDFYKADSTCRNALTTADSSMFTSAKRKDALDRNVKNIMDSEEFRQGLLGNILIEGHYVAKDAAEQQKIFQNALKEATIENAAGRWAQAVNAYRKALAVQEAYSAVQVDSRVAIEQQLALAETKLFLEKTQDSLNAGDQAKALEYLLSAQKSVTKVGPEAKEELSATINSLLAQRQFADLKVRADQLLAQSDWQGAHALFQQAMLLGRELSSRQKKDLEGLQRNVSRAGLYAVIEGANQAFGNGKWGEAAAQYSQAINMAKSGNLSFNAQEQEKISSWLTKLLLQTTIIQSRQQADAALAKGDKETAKSSLQRIINAIHASPFAGDGQFFDISNETKSKLGQINDDEFIAAKKKYLEANYKQISQSHSSDIKTDNLEEPQVSFEGKRRGKYLFQVLCKQQGSRVTLKMQYLYDAEQNRWTYYTDAE
jgi:ubiquitin-protein ligase